MSGFGIALLTAFVVITLAVDIVWSPRLMASTKARIEAGEGDARIRLYRITVVSGILQAVVALVLLVAVGVSWSEIGFNAGHSLGDALPYLIAVPVGLAASIIGVRRQGVTPRMAGDVEALIPKTIQERRWFAGVAVNAGVTEEITYRAVPVILMFALLDTDNTWLVGVIVSLLFGLAHYYQGVTGMVATAVLGGLFAAAYLMTGSLWPGMLLHALVDLRLLLIFPATNPEKAPTSQL